MSSTIVTASRNKTIVLSIMHTSLWLTVVQCGPLNASYIMLSFSDATTASFSVDIDIEQKLCQHPPHMVKQSRGRRSDDIIVRVKL